VQRDPSRPAYFGEPYGIIETPVLDRDELRPEARQGPLIIEEYEGTTVIPPRASAARDIGGNIVVTLLGDSAHAS
jgi:N-methylhydantoinase A